MCFDPNIPKPGTPDMASEIVVKDAVLPAKARFCVKCKKHLPVACFMSKNGKHDDTLCNQHEPERNGLRYCRGCEDFVALGLFPKGPKQFACKKHMNLYGGVQKSKKKQMENPDTRRRTQQWHRCYTDGKKFKLSLPRMGQAAIEVEIRKVDQTGTGNYAVMPINVKLVMSSQNVAVVTLDQRIELWKMVDACDLEEYTRMITAIRSSYN